MFNKFQTVQTNGIIGANLRIDIAFLSVSNGNLSTKITQITVTKVFTNKVVNKLPNIVFISLPPNSGTPIIVVSISVLSNKRISFEILFTLLTRLPVLQINLQVLD